MDKEKKQAWAIPQACFHYIFFFSLPAFYFPFYK